MKSRVLPLFSLLGFTLLKRGFLIPRIIQIFEENTMLLNVKNIYQQEFPGCPVVRTRCIDCQGLSSIPGQGTDPASHAVQPKINKQLKQIVI